jgi:hypothetical protein
MRSAAAALLYRAAAGTGNLQLRASCEPSAIVSLCVSLYVSFLVKLAFSFFEKPNFELVTSGQLVGSLSWSVGGETSTDRKLPPLAIKTATGGTHIERTNFFTRFRFETKRLSSFIISLLFLIVIPSSL